MSQSNWENITKEELAELAKESADAVIAQRFGVSKSAVTKKRKEFGLTMGWLIADEVLAQYPQLTGELSYEKNRRETKIIRHNLREENANYDIIEAGDFVFVGHWCHNQGQTLENQIIGALEQLAERLKLADLTLESVVQLDAMFRDVSQIPVMEKVFKLHFNGKYPVRKSIQTEFADKAIDFQLDAIAYKG